jgi:hypothetical protein
MVDWWSDGKFGLVFDVMKIRVVIYGRSYMPVLIMFMYGMLTTQNEIRSLLEVKVLLRMSSKSYNVKHLSV